MGGVVKCEHRRKHSCSIEMFKSSPDNNTKNPSDLSDILQTRKESWPIVTLNKI